jgi:hypothetical protein
MAFLGYCRGAQIGIEHGWCNRAAMKKNSVVPHTIKFNTTARVGATALAADLILFIASLVIGLLGLLSVIQGMPPAASYALVSYAGFTLLTWIFNVAHPSARELAFRLTGAMFSKNPQNYLRVCED